MSKITLITLAMPCCLSLTLLTSELKKENKNPMNPTSDAYSFSSSGTCCLRSSVSKLTEKGLEGKTAEE